MGNSKYFVKIFRDSSLPGSSRRHPLTGPGPHLTSLAHSNAIPRGYKARPRPRLPSRIIPYLIPIPQTKSAAAQRSSDPSPLGLGLVSAFPNPCNGRRSSVLLLPDLRYPDGSHGGGGGGGGQGAAAAHGEGGGARRARRVRPPRAAHHHPQVRYAR